MPLPRLPKPAAPSPIKPLSPAAPAGPAQRFHASTPGWYSIDRSSGAAAFPARNAAPVPVDHETRLAIRSGSLTVPTVGGKVDGSLRGSYQSAIAKRNAAAASRGGDQYDLGEFVTGADGLATATVRRRQSLGSPPAPAAPRTPPTAARPVKTSPLAVANVKSQARQAAGATTPAGVPRGVPPLAHLNPAAATAGNRGVPMLPMPPASVPAQYKPAKLAKTYGRFAGKPGHTPGAPPLPRHGPPDTQWQPEPAAPAVPTVGNSGIPMLPEPPDAVPAKYDPNSLPGAFASAVEGGKKRAAAKDRAAAVKNVARRLQEGGAADASHRPLDQDVALAALAGRAVLPTAEVRRPVPWKAGGRLKAKHATGELERAEVLSPELAEFYRIAAEKAGYQVAGDFRVDPKKAVATAPLRKSKAAAPRAQAAPAVPATLAAPDPAKNAKAPWDMTPEEFAGSGMKVFETSKGSMYASANGQTIRVKSPHAGHRVNDVGLKRGSEVTHFLAPEEAQKVAMWNTLSASGKRIIDNGDGVLLLTSVNPATGKRGIDERARVASATPAVGLHPVELWERSQSVANGWRSNHPGNAITRVEDPNENHHRRFVGEARIARAQPRAVAPAPAAPVPSPEEWERQRQEADEWLRQLGNAGRTPPGNVQMSRAPAAFPVPRVRAVSPVCADPDALSVEDVFDADTRVMMSRGRLDRSDGHFVTIDGEVRFLPGPPRPGQGGYKLRSDEQQLTFHSLPKNLAGKDGKPRQPKGLAERREQLAAVRAEILEHHKARGGGVPEHVALELEAMRSPFVVYKKSPVASEFRQMLREGEGGVGMAKSGAVKFTDDPKAAGAEDARREMVEKYGAKGEDYYWQSAREAAGMGFKGALADLKKAAKKGDEKAAWLVAAHDAAVAKGPKEVVDAGTLDLDETATIGGEKVRVTEDADGERILVDGTSLPDIPVAEMKGVKLPLDKGSRRRLDFDSVKEDEKDSVPFSRGGWESVAFSRTGGDTYRATWGAYTVEMTDRLGDPSTARERWEVAMSRAAEDYADHAHRRRLEARLGGRGAA